MPDGQSPLRGWRENSRESKSSRKIDGRGPPEARDNTFPRTFLGDEGDFAGNERPWPETV